MHDLCSMYIAYNYFVTLGTSHYTYQPKLLHSPLYDTTDQWFDIGFQLDVDLNDLKRIFNEGTLQNNTERLREMLTVRLNQGDLTWDHIIEA